MSPTKIAHRFPLDSVSSAVQTGNHIPERAWFSQKPLTQRINPKTQLLKLFFCALQLENSTLFVKISASIFLVHVFEYLMNLRAMNDSSLRSDFCPFPCR